VKVLVVGGGGREHALCWKLRQSPLLDDLYCAPGNPGIAEVADLVPIAAEEVAKLADFAQELRVDLTVVGPELPLTLGLVDELERRGLLAFGPRQQAAELEGSKIFAKEFMVRHGIPTAPFEVAHSPDDARAAARGFGLPAVLKADGLASGKGVLIPRNEGELEAALRLFFEDRRFGQSGERILVEPFLRGEEVSFLALCDGEHLLPLATTKDYKRLLDDDRGPNTGGMGAHSPSMVLSSDAAALLLEQVMRPAIEGMAEENRTFRGVLYAGIMLTDEGVHVLEFNARFGDPECQALMLRLEEDLLPVLVSGAQGNFGTLRLHFRSEVSVCLTLASSGYPERPVRGEPIEGVERAREHQHVEVFHAGTALRNGTLVADGGRVLNVCATAANLRRALRTAYGAAAEIEWPSKILRRDIGRRVLELQQMTPNRSGYWEVPAHLLARKS
jgi:phosphoribosylamine--glycine ligase